MMKLLPQKLMVFKVSPLFNANVFWSMYNFEFHLTYDQIQGFGAMFSLFYE
jgi:hypothetical protein